MKNIIPHPIPYQGSKRNLASKILRYFPVDFTTLYEPFAGSAAITLGAAASSLGKCYAINDLNKPLAELWKCIIDKPGLLCELYERMWSEQLHDPRLYYNKVRADFNVAHQPACLLYLLARCVKASVRYNVNGEFNQSPDNRRLGMKPDRLRKEVLGASNILAGKTIVTAVDYKQFVAGATPDDIIYMDPPYQGVSNGRDRRYLCGISKNEFVDTLASLNQRKIRYIVSYDGQTGQKQFGTKLPSHLELRHVELVAGRSTQATLLGRDDGTIESLYISPTLAEEIHEKLTVKREASGLHMQTLLLDCV